MKQILSKFGELWLISPLRLNAESAFKCYRRKKKTILEISSPSLQFTSLLLCTIQPKFPLFRGNQFQYYNVSDSCLNDTHMHTPTYTHSRAHTHTYTHILTHIHTQIFRLCKQIFMQKEKKEANKQAKTKTKP